MTKRYKLYRTGKFYDITEDFFEKAPIAPADRTAEQQKVAMMLKKAIADHTRQP